jgi:type I restriction enzyme, S subunit
MEVKPGYKQTEVGVIPEDWEAVKVGVLANFRSGDCITVSQLSPRNSHASIPVFGGNGIAGYTSYAMIGQPTVVVGRVGQKCGEVYLTEGPAWITDNALFPRTMSGRVDVRYLALALRGAGLNAVKNRNDLPLVTQSILHDVVLPLPPTKAEQEAIARALSDADALIDGLEQLVAKKRQIKLGAMQELLTGQRRLPGFTGEWMTYRFDQLFTTLRNASNSRGELSEHGDVAYVHYGDIHTQSSSFLNPGSLQTYIPREKVQAIPRLADGDLLMADASEDTTAIGKAVEIIGLNGDEAVAGLHTMVLRGYKTHLADGFKGYLQHLPKVRTALVRLATGVSVFGITKSGVKAIEVTIPKPVEQTAIAAILSDMDAEIAALEAKLAKARQVKQGMMQELLTGRIRLV